MANKFYSNSINLYPGDRTRNQIDYIMINERYRSSVSDARAYPGADANSDHNPVIANIKI